MSIARADRTVLAWVPAGAGLLAFAADILMLLVAHGHIKGHSGLLLWLGGALGVLAIPCYFLGYSRAAALIEAHTAWGRILALGAVMVAIFGAATHGLTALDIHTALADGRGARPPQEAFADWSSPLALCALAAAAGALLAAIAMMVAGARSSRRSLRILSRLNPATWTIVLTVLAGASAGTTAYLAPSAPNLAHFLFFALLARCTGPYARDA
jgi:hypothetical protein